MGARIVVEEAVAVSIMHLQADEIAEGCIFEIGEFLRFPASQKLQNCASCVNASLTSVMPETLPEHFETARDSKGEAVV